MNSYIENSTKTTKKVTDGKEEKVTIVNYEVTSIATLDYMQLVLDDINTQISDLNKEAKEAEKEENSTEENTEEKESENKTKEQIQQEKQLKIEENTKKIDTLYSKYKEVLSREYKFYTSNINMLLKDSNDKVSSVISEIDSGIEVKDDIFTYTKYIYLDLPENLEKYIDENSIDSTIELENLIKLLKKEITDLSNKNKNITNLYNEILEEALKS
jgi:hypothetical protein